MRLVERYATLVVRLRWLVLPVVGAILWAALTMLPSVDSGTGPFSDRKWAIKARSYSPSATE